MLTRTCSRRDSPAPLLVSRSLTNDDHYVMPLSGDVSCGYEFLSIAIFLNSNFLTIEVELYNCCDEAGFIIIGLVACLE